MQSHLSIAQSFIPNESVTVTAPANVSWLVDYTPANTAQIGIAETCHETYDLTVANGGTAPVP